MSQPNEKPILFSAPMVRAILGGKKSQTRRIIKTQPVTDGKAWACYWEGPNHDGQYGPSAWWLDEPPCDSMLGHCPYGKVGDCLWVRETWQCIGRQGGTSEPILHYAASDGGASRPLTQSENYWKLKDKFAFWDDERRKLCSRDGWRPSIHMPRWASRLTLEITSIKVERLADISESDCWAEGIEEVDGTFDLLVPDMARRLGMSHEDAKPTYACLWESINGKGSWSKNPWLWVVSFKAKGAANG